MKASLSATSTRYVTAPTGPERTALFHENRGRSVSIVTLMPGETSAGASMTIGVKISNCAAFAHALSFAPSSALTRQK